MIVYEGGTNETELLIQEISAPQTIRTTISNGPTNLNSASSSGYPVRYELISGPGILSGNTITPTGEGAIVLRVYQDGDSAWESAIPIYITLIASVEQGGVRIRSILKEPEGFALRWHAYESAAYRIMSSTNLLHWVEVPESRFRGMGDETVFVLPESSSDKNFFFVDIVPFN
jgi:hypothetical protein